MHTGANKKVGLAYGQHGQSLKGRDWSMRFGQLKTGSTRFTEEGYEANIFALMVQCVFYVRDRGLQRTGGNCIQAESYRDKA